MTMATDDTNKSTHTLIQEKRHLEAKITYLRAVLSDNLQAWEGEEESVKEEHAELIEEARAALEETKEGARTMHTPGPWIVSGDLIKSGDGNVACVLSDNPNPDALLIAAAPDLLAAIEMVERKVSAGIDFYQHEIQELRIAISKAKGS